jgi:putative transposase
MKAYKYKLKLNKSFVAGCEKTLAVCHELYNASIQERKEAWQRKKLSLNYQTQSVQLPEIKSQREDVKVVYSQVLQDTLKRSDKAFQAFFRRVKQGQTPGYPRFKSHDRFDSFTYPGTGFSLKGDKLFLSKIGSCRVRLSREVEGKIKTCTIKRECDGWYVIFTAEGSVSKPLPKTGINVGVDVGIEYFATLSTGEHVENPKFFKKSELALREAQQKLSTKKRGSSKRKAAKKIVSKVHRKVQNQRKDFAHKLANNLINRFDEIHIEDLNVKRMAQDENFAKSIHDAAWNTFFQICTYKAVDAGKSVHEKVAAFTSQDCCECGQRMKLTIYDRFFVCTNCENRKHRDHNAAINILKGRAVPRKQTFSESPTKTHALSV